jgi:hypothetical protein
LSPGAPVTSACTAVAERPRAELTTARAPCRSDSGVSRSARRTVRHARRDLGIGDREVAVLDGVVGVGLRQLRLEVLVRRGADSVVDAERVQGRRRSRVYVTEAG